MARYRLRFQLQQLELRHGATVIGRGEDCDLSVEDPLVSRRHARLLVNEDGITLEDLGSRNGVFLNGRRVGRGPGTTTWMSQRRAPDHVVVTLTLCRAKPRQFPQPERWRQQAQNSVSSDSTPRIRL